MIEVKDLNDLKLFSIDLAKKIKINDIYVLDGDLGAGKTSLVQFLCKNLKVSGTINSPTFPIVNSYQGDFQIYHFDLYRIEHQDELENIGFYEYLSEPAVVFIEWGSKFKEEIPDTANWIYIKVDDSGHRVISINNE
jgi:tRNA threonylcarbamoyladenosine biosynthesis protein TsaE